jgi:hypothetical protein
MPILLRWIEYQARPSRASQSKHPFHMADLNSAHFPDLFFHTNRPFRHRPARWCPRRREWIQDDRALRNVKTSKAFVWPKDGRNGTAWGRLKDIMQNKGPDIYVTMNADKHDYMANRPTKAQWAGYPGLGGWDPWGPWSFPSWKYAPWTGKGVLGGRTPGQSYDFRTRRYGNVNRSTWTDAFWQPSPRVNERNPNPEAIRNVYGEWFQDRHYLPESWGGPVHNERGRGF